MPIGTMTEQQKAWFASVRAGLERDTGMTLDAWVEIARTCPETKPNARLAWFKMHHGLGRNRAMQILDAAFPSADNAPEAQRAALWKDPGSTALLTAFEVLIAPLPDVVATQRKGYSAWSRRVQFAALKPLKGGQAILGLALPLYSASGFMPARIEGWSERLTVSKIMMTPVDISPLFPLVHQAWETS